LKIFVVKERVILCVWNKNVDVLPLKKKRKLMYRTYFVFQMSLKLKFVKPAIVMPRVSQKYCITCAITFLIIAFSRSDHPSGISTGKALEAIPIHTGPPLLKPPSLHEVWLSQVTCIYKIPHAFVSLCFSSSTEEPLPNASNLRCVSGVRSLSPRDHTDVH
jgi:hypothetical protein